MDLMTLDVTDLAEPPHAGDEVELLGDHDHAGRGGRRLAGTNEYEILTRLRRVPSTTTERRREPERQRADE